MYTEFAAGLGAKFRAKQVTTIEIQRRIGNIGERYYDGFINVMGYLDGLSFPVANC
jgi:hypothetical protein